MTSRREFLAALGATSLAGCSRQIDARRSAAEIHESWIYGEDDEFLEIARNEIDLEAIENEMVGGMETGPEVDRSATIASRQYQTEDTYEHRHRVICSALHHVANRDRGVDLNLDILSNMNHVQTENESFQYSEIIVKTKLREQEENDFEIINAALTADTNHATHAPGEEVTNPTENRFKQLMVDVRFNDFYRSLTPHRVGAIQHRVDNGGPKGLFASKAALMGYQLFAGGHRTEDAAGYSPDQLLVPATKQVHRTIADEKYWRHDLTLTNAINEQYFNNGYDDVEGPVVVDVEETAEGWDIELYDRPDWSEEMGYPGPANSLF